MSQTLIIILAGVVVLGAVSFLLVRWRRSVGSAATDRESGPDVPLLYVPQPRNTSVPSVQQVDSAFMSQTAAQPRFKPVQPVQPVRPPQAQPVATRAKYLAPDAGPGYDGVVQLLPGRLVPTDASVGQEIRFVKTPGVNRFTFGRSPGPAHTHVRLLAPTASRMHAYMVFDNGRWRIGNMSETNQVLVNGAPLHTGEAERWLDDGDRIELGEVGFIFRER